MEPVKCHPQQGRCYTSVAMCILHSGQSNVSDDLRTWLTNSNVRSTLFTMYSLQCRSCSGPCETNVSKEDRAKLQKGQLARDFLDEELTAFFENDLRVSKDMNPKVKPVPSGEASFMFTKIAGKTRDVQIFFDTGCNCAILR